MFIFEFVLSIFAKPKVKYENELKVRLSCEGVKPKVKFKSMSVKLKMSCEDVKPLVKFKAVYVEVRLCEHVKPKVKFNGMSVKTKVRIKCKHVKPKVKIKCIKLVLSASLA